jgi:hydroxymethylpyrimidine/phosphomethylpyrimidine kinase
MVKIPCVLIIAGSDSGGGAGMQADLKTCAALGVHGMSAFASITAQNTTTVTAIHDIPPEMVKAQIDTVISDIEVHVAKTGMLHTVNIIKVVAEEIKKHKLLTVVDPVMIAKGGAPLLQPEAIETYIKTLIPLTAVLTPNAMEAERLSGIKVNTLDDAKNAASKIAELGTKAVVVKGGHILSKNKAIDVLYANDEFHLIEGERIETNTTHGTGCSFASAIAANLAKGKDTLEAVKVAKDFITRAIKYGIEIGHGYGPVNPMANLYNEAEKYNVIQNVNAAVEILEGEPSVANLVPESQINIAMLSSYAMDYRDAAAIPGRIIRLKNGVKASSCPEFGASRHVAKTIQVAAKYNPSIRAAMNILYSEEIINIIRNLGLVTSFYDRREEPPEIKNLEGMTTPWGTEQAIKRVGRVPDAIFHDGDWGKEAMIVLLGKDAVGVAKLAVKIAKTLG